MITRIEQLPDPGPRWLSQQIKPKSGTLSKPITLFYRDGMDVVKKLLSHPILTPKMVFGPKKAFDTGWDGENLGRKYSDLHTGDYWPRMQVSIAS